MSRKKTTRLRHKWLSFGLSLVLFLAAEAALVSLAAWQYSRAVEKKALLAELAVRHAEPALELPLLTPETDWSALAWRRVVASGVFDFSRQVVLDNQPDGERIGWRVLTPLRLPGGREVVVDRGWTPRLDNPALLPRPASGLAEVEGVIRLWPQRRGWLHGPVEGIQPGMLMFLAPESIPVAAQEARLPVWVQASTATQPELHAFVAPFDALPPSRHWGYMSTWATLAVLLPGMYVLAVYRRLKREK